MNIYSHQVHASINPVMSVWLIKCFWAPHKHFAISPRYSSTWRSRHVRGYTFCDWGWRLVVSKPIITIHNKDDLPRPSPSSPYDRGFGPPPPPGCWWNSEDRGPLGLHVLLHLLPLRTHREIALGISLMPLPCLIPSPVRPLQLLPVHSQALWETFSKYW